jgi:hypothetical protein
MLRGKDPIDTALVLGDCEFNCLVNISSTLLQIQSVHARPNKLLPISRRHFVH